MLESTIKSLPRYFSIVLALAGDSTITKFLLMVHLLSKHKCRVYGNTGEMSKIAPDQEGL